MSNTYQIVTLNSGGSEDAGRRSIFVRLEQEDVDNIDEFADLRDIYNMIIRAASGIPASTYKQKECPMYIVDRTIFLFIDFLVWPSSIDLQFTLRAAIGKIVNLTRIDRSVDFDAIFGLTDYYDLGYVIDRPKFDWMTKCFNSQGEVVPYPEVTVDGNRILLSEPVFGVARVSGTALGYSASNLIEIPIPEGQQIEDSHLTRTETYVHADWIDEDGWLATESLQLIVPQCIIDAMNMCDGNGPPCTITFSRKVWAGPTTIYFSKCDGSVVEIRPPDLTDEEWCGDTLTRPTKYI